jgi:hypothetical protein
MKNLAFVLLVSCSFTFFQKESRYFLRSGKFPVFGLTTPFKMLKFGLPPGSGRFGRSVARISRRR